MLVTNLFGFFLTFVYFSHRDLIGCCWASNILCFPLCNDRLSPFIMPLFYIEAAFGFRCWYENIVHGGKWLLFFDNSSYANECVFIENHCYVSPLEIYSHIHSLPYTSKSFCRTGVQLRERLSKRHLWEADCRLLNVQLILNNVDVYVFLECWARVTWEMAGLCMNNTVFQRFSNLFQLQNC